MTFGVQAIGRQMLKNDAMGSGKAHGATESATTMGQVERRIRATVAHALRRRCR